MPCMLDLPDELLLKIIAWVPYRPGSHDQLPLVCRHFRSLVGVKALSGMIAWYQFAPFMRLLEGYRGRSTAEYSRAELVQTWKSIAMHREWIGFVKETTGLNSEICLTAISIVHFIAASNRKLLDWRGVLESARDTLSFVFFVKSIRILPPYSVLLVRYLIKTTLRDCHDRHMPYDRLHFLRRWSTGELNEDQCKSKLFILNCINASTFALLDGYRPFYNLLADVTFHSEFHSRDSLKAIKVISLLDRSSLYVEDSRGAKSLLGSFALHARLVELSKEGEILSPLNVKVDGEMDFWRRLSFEYTRMQAIDEQLDKKFGNMQSTPDAIRDLDLEGIGRSLKDITTQLQAMREEDLREHRKEIYEIYKLDQWE